MAADNEQSYIAAQARSLCSESDEHHERVWFCMTCMALRERLKPINEAITKALLESDISVDIKVKHIYENYFQKNSSKYTIDSLPVRFK